ncbi:MAG: 3-methyl-2-oxobutanoate hydroxymethyltransferase [Fibrobacteria bacterium]|nr:3-methyl-2-oxobutanoate hydroxymethyltransferase [Fibrobacteria bacterium]
MNAFDQFARFADPSVAPLSMVTCYDAPFAALAHEAGIDILLVGDSVANAVLGHARTTDIGMPVMLHHVAAVRRGAPDACILADMPFGADSDAETALANARALVDAGADAVKLEGPRLEQVRAISEAGIAVCGHLGLLPQTATTLRQAAQDQASRDELLRDALALEEAGCVGVVLEHIPSEVGASVTRALRIPTVGIGAGPGCRGQVLVLHDVLGISARRPPFAKAWVDLRTSTLQALRSYHRETASGTWPPA